MVPETAFSVPSSVTEVRSPSSLGAMLETNQTEGMPFSFVSWRTYRLYPASRPGKR